MKGPIPRTPIERLKAKVPNWGDDGCWEFTGYRLPSGYGQVGVGGHGVALTHRVSYEAEVGPVPDGMSVLHQCDNPPCVRPSHLFLGTDADNSDDKVAKSRQAMGERVPSARLTEAAVAAIRCRTHETHAALAREFGVVPSTIRKAREGQTWRHVQEYPVGQLPLFGQVG